MNKMQYQLMDFQRAMKQTIGVSRGLRDTELRANLIEEEAKETVEAIRAKDFVKAVDGICDLLYVVVGSAVAFGFDVEQVFDEVHRTNMLKATGPVREDGKRMKPEGWQPPDIEGCLQRQGEVPLFQFTYHGVQRDVKPESITYGKNGWRLMAVNSDGDVRSFLLKEIVDIKSPGLLALCSSLGVE